MLHRVGTDDPARVALVKAVREGVKYGLQSAGCGEDDDWDPDAVVQNAIVGVLGYFTPDGTRNTSDLSIATDKEL